MDFFSLNYVGMILKVFSRVRYFHGPWEGTFFLFLNFIFISYVESKIFEFGFSIFPEFTLTFYLGRKYFLVLPFIPIEATFGSSADKVTGALMIYLIILD